MRGTLARTTRLLWVCGCRARRQPNETGANDHDVNRLDLLGLLGLLAHLG